MSTYVNNEFGGKTRLWNESRLKDASLKRVFERIYVYESI